MKKLLLLSLMLLVVSGFFAGCKKDKGDPPLLPPAESMAIDFSNFIISQTKSANPTDGLKGIENSNWEFAALAATTWNLILSGTLIVPVAAFDRAIDQDPVYLSKNYWQWTYTVQLGSIAYTARLTGQILTDNVEWKMHITKEGTGGYAEFLWFEGTSSIDGTEGKWILNESNIVQNPLLQIDWTRAGESIGTIKYTFVKNTVFKNSYIEYGLTSGTLNAYYKIYFFNENLDKFSEVDVEWSTANHNGRVKSIDYLGDSNWYCWDTNKVNVSCN